MASFFWDDNGIISQALNFNSHICVGEATKELPKVTKAAIKAATKGGEGSHQDFESTAFCSAR